MYHCLVNMTCTGLVNSMCVLADNDLKAEGATALAPALAELKLLQNLNLHGTWRQCSALRVGLKVACVWRPLPTYTDLANSMCVLAGNRVGPRGATALAPALAELKQLKNLNLSGTWRQCSALRVGLKVACVWRPLPTRS